MTGVAMPLPMLRAARMRAGTAVLALLVPAIALPARAQLIGGSARGAGMGDAYGAVARGASAGLYNPALLGLSGNPGFSLNLPSAVADLGTTPITLRDVGAYGGRVIPDDVKRAWLARLAPGDRLTGDVGLVVPALGFSVGSFAVNVASVGEARMSLPRDAVELLLFGNATSTGTPRDLDIGGSTGTTWASTVVALSFGQKVYDKAGMRVSAGVTAKYVTGQGLAEVQPNTGVLTADPLRASIGLPLLYFGNRQNPISSFGLAFDVGFALQRGPLTASLGITDAVSTFKWRESDARVREATVFVNTDSTVTRVEEQDVTSDASSYRARMLALVAGATFKPAARLALAYQLAPNLLLSGDLVYRTASAPALQAGSRGTVSAGLEYRPVRVLPLRAGGVLLQGGTYWTVGTGLELGVFNVNVAYGRRYGDLGGGERLSFGIGFGNGR